MVSGVEKEKRRAREKGGEGLGFYDCTGFGVCAIGSGQWSSKWIRWIELDWVGLDSFRGSGCGGGGGCEFVFLP